jgi:hypothetical protein
MGNVFGDVKTTYTEMFEKTVGAASAEVLPVAATVRKAYENQAANTAAAQRYEAAKTALVDHLTPIAPFTATTLGHMFDVAHAQPPAPITPQTSTADSVAAAGQQVAAAALGSISGTLKLSGPTLLGTKARSWFGIVSAVIAGGSIAAVSLLANTGMAGTAVYVALAIAIFLAMLTLLLCITGYANVDIEGSRGDSGASSQGTSASGQ